MKAEKIAKDTIPENTSVYGMERTGQRMVREMRKSREMEYCIMPRKEGEMRVGWGGVR
jgi:hypothetical protein